MDGAGQLGLWADPEPEDDPTADPAALRPRIGGGLLGMACGDALGTEGQPGTAGRRAGDSDMALRVAESILANPKDPLPSGTPRLREPSTANGSLARALPVALAYPDARTLLFHSARFSATTHWDPQPEVCSAVYGLWIRELFGGMDLYAGWRAAIRAARDYEKGGPLALDTPGPAPLPDDFWKRLENVTDLAYRDLQPSGYAGYCLECLEASAWCAVFAADAEQAITDAVSLGGAAATLGALAGGAAGVFWGEAALPARWTGALEERQRIERLADGIAMLRAESLQRG